MDHDKPARGAAQSPRPQAAVAPNRQRLAAEWKSAAPVLDHEPAADHAAEVREMRHAGGGAGHAEDELERREREYEDARRQRDRRKEEQHAPVREIHAEREQQTVNPAGG